MKFSPIFLKYSNVTDEDMRNMVSVKLISPDGISAVNLNVQSASVKRNGKLKLISPYMIHTVKLICYIIYGLRSAFDYDCLRSCRNQ